MSFFISKNLLKYMAFCGIIRFNVILIRQYRYLEELRMLRIFKKEEVMTTPNLLTVFRILLLPLIVWLYIFKENYTAAILILLISGLTDIVDGFVARKFNMVSDLGKILDPFADKLTQWTLFICLAMRYKVIIFIVCLFFVKEMILAFMGYIIIKRKDRVNSAKWYGKLNTVIIYTTIVILIIFPDIPMLVVTIMSIICIATIIGSMLMYVSFYLKQLRPKK